MWLCQGVCGVCDDGTEGMVTFVGWRGVVDDIVGGRLRFGSWITTVYLYWLYQCLIGMKLVSILEVTVSTEKST